jgi:hypothetical protein
MKTFFICVGIIWLIAVGIMIHHILTAPMGYEDEDGFHEEKDKK